MSFIEQRPGSPRSGRAERRLVAAKAGLDERAQQRAIEAKKSPVEKRPEERPSYKKKLLVPAVSLALLTLISEIREAGNIDVSSASELGPTPRVLLTPEETMKEMALFDQTIEEIREPGVVVSEATPQATEIQQEKTEQNIETVQVEFQPGTICNVELLGVTNSSIADSVLEKFTPDKMRVNYPELDLELRERTRALMSWASKQPSHFCSYNPPSKAFGDWLIYIYLNSESNGVGIPKRVPALSYERVYSTLAFEEVNVRESNIPRVLERLEEPMRVINRMLSENVDPLLFRDGVVPQLPTRPQEIMSIIVFPGYPDHLMTAGLGWEGHPVLFGNYWSPEYSYDDIERTLIVSYAHEVTHSLLQIRRTEDLRRVDFGSPEGKYVHSLHVIFEDLTIRMLNLGNVDPSRPLVYIYGSLIEDGYKPEEILKIMLNSVVTGSCLFPEPEEINRVFAGAHWRELPPETQREIEEAYGKYKEEFVRMYMKYASQG